MDLCLINVIMYFALHLKNIIKNIDS